MNSQKRHLLSVNVLMQNRGTNWWRIQIDGEIISFIKIIDFSRQDLNVCACMCRYKCIYVYMCMYLNMYEYI